MSRGKFIQRITKRIKSKTENLNDLFNVTFIRLVGILLRFYVLLAISRQIGVEQFGIYTYVIQIMTMIAIISFLGADQYISKVLPQGLLNKKNDLVSKITTSLAIISFTSSLILTIVIFILSKISNLIPLIYLIQTILGTLLVLPILFMMFQNALFRANGNPASSQIFENIISPIFLIFFFFALKWWTEIIQLMITAYEIIIITIISYYIVSAIGLYFLFKRIQIKPIFDFKNCLETLRELAPLCLFIILYQLFFRYPILYIGHYLGAIDVAHYFAASRVAEFIEFPLGIFSIVYISKYSAFNDFEREKKQNILRNASIGLSLSSLLIFTIILCFKNQIFSLFGEGMSGSNEVYIALGFGYTIASMTGFVDFALIRAGHAAKVNIALLLSLTIMVLLLTVLPISTPKDVALIFSFSWILKKFLMAYFLWKNEQLSVIPYSRYFFGN
jgi:O-antigen/teichoic acid export membrane protein